MLCFTSWGQESRISQGAPRPSRRCIFFLLLLDDFRACGQLSRIRTALNSWTTLDAPCQPWARSSEKELLRWKPLYAASSTKYRRGLPEPKVNHFRASKVDYLGASKDIFCASKVNYFSASKVNSFCHSRSGRCAPWDVDSASIHSAIHRDLHMQSI